MFAGLAGGLPAPPGPLVVGGPAAGPLGPGGPDNEYCESFSRQVTMRIFHVIRKLILTTRLVSSGRGWRLVDLVTRGSRA